RLENFSLKIFAVKIICYDCGYLIPLSKSYQKIADSAIFNMSNGVAKAPHWLFMDLNLACRDHTGLYNLPIYWEFIPRILFYSPTYDPRIPFGTLISFGFE
ncbi:MAG: hypothetical protein Q8N81_07815, partial [bacterium]|nr:hypothetical protein [bacterium]